MNTAKKKNPNSYVSKLMVSGQKYYSVAPKVLPLIINILVLYGTYYTLGPRPRSLSAHSTSQDHVYNIIPI